jgi:hypothetical protein
LLSKYYEKVLVGNRWVLCGDIGSGSGLDSSVDSYIFFDAKEYAGFDGDVGFE